MQKNYKRDNMDIIYAIPTGAPIMIHRNSIGIITQTCNKTTGNKCYGNMYK